MTIATRRSEEPASGPEGGTRPAIVWAHPDPTRPPLDLGRPGIVGRDEACDVPLPGEELSRRHARIEALGPLTLLRDLGSTNGLFVNGARVDAHPLAPGDLVRLGEWIGVVREVASLAPPAYERHGDGLYGGPVLAPVIRRAREAARGPLPISIEGETGTGKERIARAIHAWSGRSGPFVALNCAALTPSTAYAELFGHERGAFTGADRAAAGYVRSADGGTLLLDEITDLPRELQGGLLRLLQEREVVPVGSSRPRPVDVKILAAGQVPLGRAVEEGRLRADLHARLNGWALRLPPLRARREEIPFLLRARLREVCGFEPPLSPRLVEALCLHAWPQNVRELATTADRLALRAGRDAPLRIEDLPETLALTVAGAAAGEVPGDGAAAADAERALRERVRGALAEEGGNVTRAAARLGITRGKLYRVLEADRRAGKGGAR